MKPISEETLRQTRHPLYDKRKKEMRDAERKLLAAFKKVADWGNSRLKDQRAFLKLCHESFSVAFIMINNATFPSEPKFLFKGDLWCLARANLRQNRASFNIRIATVEEKDDRIYFRRPRTFNRAAWYRSEPRGDDVMLCDFFGHKRMGYIDPEETMAQWLKYLYGTLPFNRIAGVQVEKTDVLFFEHPFYIVKITTNKKGCE